MFTITNYKEKIVIHAYKLTNVSRNLFAALFMIPNNLPCRQDTSIHRAGDSLLEGWATDFLWNLCFDIGIMYPFATTPGISPYSYFDYGW